MTVKSLFCFACFMNNLIQNCARFLLDSKGLDVRSFSLVVTEEMRNSLMHAC